MQANFQAHVRFDDEHAARVRFARRADSCISQSGGSHDVLGSVRGHVSNLDLPFPVSVGKIAEVLYCGSAMLVSDWSAHKYVVTMFL
jgi:hypothetical protein